MNDRGLCIVLGKLVSVQLRDLYFDEGISKCRGFRRNTLGGGEKKKKHERNAKSFSIRALGEEKVSCVRFLKLDLFKRSSCGNNDDTMTRISCGFKLNTIGGGGGDEVWGWI